MRRSILLTMLFTLFTALTVGAAEPWQYSFSKETSPCFKNKGVYSQFTSPLIELDEPTEVIRLTVFATRNTDMNSGQRTEGFSNSAPAFPTFAISELRILDKFGDPVELYEENFETNALSLNEGGLYDLSDFDINTYFHSTYSDGEAPQAYHYINIILPDAMDKFTLEYDSRLYWYFTDPTYIAITGGTEALPWNEEGFVLGEQVTDTAAIKPNTFYALRGSYFEYTRIDNQSYEPLFGNAFYHSPHGAALTPSMASVFYLEDAGEGKYYMRWLKNDHYLSKYDNMGASEYAAWNDNVKKASAITFLPCDTVAGAFQIKDGVLNLGQRRNIRMNWVTDSQIAYDTKNTYHYAWNVYNVDFSNTAVAPILQASIDKAEALIEEQGGYMGYEEDILMPEALSAAKDIVLNASASAKEMFDRNVALNAAINEYRNMYLYALIDSVTEIFDDENIIFCDPDDDWVAGAFPEEYRVLLENSIDRGYEIADAAKNYDDIDACINSICETLASFWAARVGELTSFPIVLTEECGLKNNLKDNIYYWDSPMYYLDEPTDVIRMTVFKNSSGETEPDYNVGTPFFCLGEFILYDVNGNKMELREDMFSTNSLQTHDGSGLAGLCDGNPYTFYHGCYAPDSTNGSYAPEKAFEGEYCYIEVKLDEEISAFSYGFVSRQYPYDYYMHLPLYFAFTPGEEITKDDADDILADVPDEFEVVLGEKIKSVEEIVPGELYALSGNLNVVKNGTEPTGFYNSFNSVSGKTLEKACAVVFEKAEEGGYYIRNIAGNMYMKKPTHWAGVSTTYYQDESFPMTIAPSTNLAEAFKIYYQGMVTLPDTATRYYNEEVYYMLQDWGSYMGLYPVKDFSEDDTDGESDWCIYRMSMQRRGKFELKSVVATIKAEGVDFDYVGEAVGMYSGNDVTELVNAVNKSEALLSGDDDAECRAVAGELQGLLQTAVRSLEMNEFVSGQNYVIRSANDEFIPYHGDEKFAMYVGPTNYEDTHRDNETMLWWTYEYAYGLDSAAYQFTFVEDTVRLEGDATESGWGKYTIKSVLADQYIVPEIGPGKNLVVGEFDPSLAPRIYVVPGEKPGLRRFVGAEAWRSNENIYSYFEVRTGGGGYGTGGEAHYGHVAQWYFLANTAQWKLIPVANTTSIDDLVVDEPMGDEVVSVSYYTPAGIATGKPVKGVNIVKIVYANGVIETKKIFVK
ncbi:MAG: hypothetical protein IKC70_03925 [Bacteroidaceae bacterium]|nr:hypothetical protein [Bacteroidaceae bacterium]